MKLMYLYWLVFSVFLSGCEVVPVKNHSDSAVAAAYKELVKEEKSTEAEAEEPKHAVLKNKRISISAFDMPAKEFFMGLVKGSGVNMVVHPEVKGTLSFQLNDVTLKDVLQAARDTYGYDFRKQDYGYQILPKQLQTRIYHINYLNISRTGTSNMIVSAGQVSNAGSSGGDDDDDDSGSSSATSAVNSSSIETANSADFWLKLQQTLKMIVGNEINSTVVVDAHSGVVVVRALPSIQRDINHFLQRAELSLKKQVIIEAKILEVALSDGYQQGIRWDNIGAGVNGTLTNGIREVSTSLGADTLVSPGGIGGIFGLSVNSGDIFGVIELLQTQGDVQVLSSPRISTLNNQKAVIKVGSDEYFVTEVSVNSTNTSSGITQTPEVTLTPFFSGIALDVTPQIGEDNEVILHVHPSVTEVQEKTKTINLSNSQLNLPLAFSTIRETDTIVKAKSGQVIVIGGLLQSKTEQIESRVPWLGSIPWIGNLFTQIRESHSKSELVILLQPHVIDDPDDWKHQVDQINDRLTPYFNSQMN